MGIRSQLPGSSPLSGRALARGVSRALRGGEEARAGLRDMLQRRFGGEAVLLQSGTQALQTALRAATSLPGLESTAVAVPAYSCYDLVSACVGADVQVEFYDLDPGTLSPDLDSLEGALRRGARVVVAGNLYGFPLDWGSLRSRVDSVEGLLIEDAAQGIGSVWEDRPGGAFGDVTVLSFGRGKGWTGGGGGALLIRDPRLASGVGPPSGGSPAWGLRPLAGSVAHWVMGRPAVYGLPRSIPGLALGETIYHAPTPPEPMASLSAALVLATADDAEAEVEHRRRAAATWSEALPAGPWTRPSPVAGGGSAFLRFPIVTSGDSIRDRLLRELERFGAAPGYPRPLPELEASARITGGPPQRDLKGARILARQLLTLPTHSLVEAVDQSKVLRAFRVIASR